MKAQLRANRISLSRDEVVTLTAARGQVLRCVEGSLWLTTSDLPGDHVLEAGDCFTVPGHARLVIEALRPARIAFVPCESRMPRQTAAIGLVPA
jgi:hypothetical protein